MHSKSDNTELMVKDETDKTFEGLIKSLLSGYHIGFEISKESSNFFYCAYLLYYSCHKIDPNHIRIPSIGQ